MTQWLEWMGSWLGGGAVMAFLLGHPDVGWCTAVLSLGALACALMLRPRERL